MTAILPHGGSWRDALRCSPGRSRFVLREPSFCSGYFRCRCSWERQDAGIVPAVDYVRKIVSVGKSIRLYLADGLPGGLLTAEIMNWTGHVVAAPRSDLAALLKRQETARTGIYIL